ncbi:type II secretion system major pseudopilin GspG [Akkermansiaceae bacterium]|nr:type II secretion system major pseudopilin GspG [Akkermansiaceae bacterium]MDB4537122.1 type II secretion system major pseudopilin GspG [Akkermansiaceae bacterium]
MKIQVTKNNQRRPRLARGFSLFEMVIVMGIIGVILGSVIFMSKSFGDSARVQTARQDFTTLITHLDQYRNIGRSGYPTQPQGLEALVKKPSSSPIPRDWVQSLPEVPKDPWGNKYEYKFPGSKKANEPELISAGPDGIPGNDDDLSSQD